MFERLGQFVVKHWSAVLISWVAALVLVFVMAPPFETQVTDGAFAFLPADSPSLVAEQMFRDAFPDQLGLGDEGDESTVRQNPLGSNIVIVVRRADPLTRRSDAIESDTVEPDEVGASTSIEAASSEARRPKMTDEEFVETVLVPALERTAAEVKADDGLARLGRVWTFADKEIGPLLTSPDGHATLVLLELTTEFLERSNGDLIGRIETLLASDREIQRQLPAGLELTISGSATVGRDMIRAEEDSGKRVETVTPIVVIGLLLLIYRAPLVAIIPLATVGAAVTFTLRFLSGLCSADLVGLFQGLEVYVRVVMYGAGVDYCLFLIARYREGLVDGLDYRTALSSAIGHVGPALATSAGTSVVGIGMMMLSDFGKFQQAGFGIAVGLTVVLIAALTFLPALLAMLERAAFWPQFRSEKAADSVEPIAAIPAASKVRAWLTDVWNVVGLRIEARPVLWLLVGIGVLIPPALFAPYAARHLSYGLLSDLPQDEPSVVGAIAVQEHFPAGMTGPVSVLIESPDLADVSAERVSQTLTDALVERADELQLADVRSQSEPLGISDAAQEYLDAQGAGGRPSVMSRGILRVRARRMYLSDTEAYPRTVARMDLIFESDPFGRDAIQLISDAEQVIREALPESIRDTSRVFLLGPTASIRDLKTVTDSDQIRIQVGVSLAVYVLIVVLLRRPAVCLFLIGSVVASYMTTLGLCYLFFYAVDPTGFSGLDWKVPIFLFTLLIALGEDYNILLMARVVEEQKTHGPVTAIRVAMGKTGGIISSCGLIMAGTFAALMSGTLAGMIQLGFALTAGVLIDTFLVRPVIVPAWLIVLNSGRLGTVGTWLGAETESDETGQPQALAD